MRYGWMAVVAVAVAAAVRGAPPAQTRPGDELIDRLLELPARGVGPEAWRRYALKGPPADDAPADLLVAYWAAKVDEWGPGAEPSAKVRERLQDAPDARAARAADYYLDRVDTPEAWRVLWARRAGEIRVVGPRLEEFDPASYRSEVARLHGIRFDSAAMWVDEGEGRAYVASEGSVLRVPLGAKAATRPAGAVK